MGRHACVSKCPVQAVGCRGAHGVTVPCVTVRVGGCAPGTSFSVRLDLRSLAGPRGCLWLSGPWWVGVPLLAVTEPRSPTRPAKIQRDRVQLPALTAAITPLTAACDTRPVSSAFAPLRGLISIPAQKQNYPHCSFQDVINFNLGPKDSTMEGPPGPPHMERDEGVGEGLGRPGRRGEGAEQGEECRPPLPQRRAQARASAGAPLGGKRN